MTIKPAPTITIENFDKAYQEYATKNFLNRESNLTKPLFQWQLREDKDSPCMIFLMRADRFDEGGVQIKIERHIVSADGLTTLPVYMQPDYVPTKPVLPEAGTKPIDLVIEILEELQQAGVTDIRTWKSVDSETFEPLITFSIPYRITKE